MIILSAFCYGVTPVLAVYAYREGITVITLLIIRFTAAAIFFVLYCFLKRRNIKVNVSRSYPATILGFLFAVTSFLYFSSFKYISTSLAVMTHYVYPIFVSVLNFFWSKNAISRKTLLSMTISFGGLVLVIGTSIGKVNLFGIFLTVISAITYSIYIVYGSKIVRDIPSILTSAIVTSTASICFIIAGLAAREIDFNFGVRAWIPISGIILLSTVLAILAFFWGLDLLGSTKASLICMTEPVFTVTISSIAFDQRLTVGQLIGGMAVLAGAIVGSLPDKIHSKEDESLHKMES
jgi:drug/metabolite transporter (DMT)-like permease